jgi:hypothetical protein
MIQDLLNFFKNIINALIDGLVAAITFVFNLLPDTPFNFPKIEWGNFGKLIGAFIPVADIATHFVLILSAFGLYYAVRWILRVIRMVQ